MILKMVQLACLVVVVALNGCANLACGARRRPTKPRLTGGSSSAAIIIPLRQRNRPGRASVSREFLRRVISSSSSNETEQQFNIRGTAYGHLPLALRVSPVPRSIRVSVGSCSVATLVPTTRNEATSALLTCAGPLLACTRRNSGIQGDSSGLAGSPRNSRSNCLTRSLARRSSLNLRALPITCCNSSSLMAGTHFRSRSYRRPTRDRD